MHSEIKFKFLFFYRLRYLFNLNYLVQYIKFLRCFTIIFYFKNFENNNENLLILINSILIFKRKISNFNFFFI